MPHAQPDYRAAAQLAAEFERLRACGLSARKVDTLQGIARAALDGRVPSRAAAAAAAAWRPGTCGGCRSSDGASARRLDSRILRDRE